MKRILWWGMSTLSAVVLIFGYHTSTSGAGVASAIQTPTISSSGSSASTPGASSGSTFTGNTVNTRYGPVQVTITVSGDNKVTDVSVPQYPNSNPRDTEINQRALPVLIQETIDQQSATVDMVSGATYTSEGYRQSLQSALDEAQL